MAAEEINAKGGIQVGNKKMKIQLIKADSNEFLNLTDATNAMERLITRDKVDFVVGGFRTEAVLPMQDIAMENKKIFIGFGAATDELCNRVAKNYNTYKYWFRGSPFNSTFLVRTGFIHLGTVAAIVKQSLNIPKIKVAVVMEKAQWADAMIAAAEATIPKMGMEVVGTFRPSHNGHGCHSRTVRHSAFRSPYHFHDLFRPGGNSVCQTGRRTQDSGYTGRHQCGGPER